MRAVKETDIQQIVIDVVRAAGGEGHKLSNRFLIGVSDLLIKLPPDRREAIGGAWRNNPPAGFIEVKQRAYPSTDDHFRLDVTRPQALFLEAFAKAGMPCGVASFLQSGTGSGLKLWLHLMTWQTASYSDATMAPFTTHRRAHVELGRKGERENRLLSALYNWQKEWREGK